MSQQEEDIFDLVTDQLNTEIQNQHENS